MSCFRRGVLSVAVVVLAALCAVAQERVCTVKGIMGSVRVLSSRDDNALPGDIGTWPEARLGMTLREKDLVATLPESEARLETADGSTIRLKENTLVALAALSADGTKLRLEEGSLVTSVKKMTGGRAKFQFETPTSLAAVRGTNVEVDVRKNHGTTYKTFDGSLEAGAKKNKKSRASVGNYQMVEIGSEKRANKVQNIPSHYRPKTTKLLNEEDMAALTGFRRVILTYAELEEVKAQFERDGIVSGIGMAEADDEMTARKMSTDAARKELAVTMDTRVQRLAESYSQNVDGRANTIWEETVRQLTNVNVRGSTVHTTITQYNAVTGKYRIFSLMIMEPDRFKNVFAAESEKNEEFELRVKKEDLMKNLDAAIEAYDKKYHDR